MMYRPRVDAFTQLVDLLRPKTLLLGMLRAQGRWGVQIPAQRGPAFYLMLAGEACFRAADGEFVRLTAGDYLLSAHAEADTFTSDTNIQPVLADDNFKKKHSADGEMQIGRGSGLPATRVMGGVVLCEPANVDVLAGLLPPFIHVRGGTETGNRLHRLLAAAREEADATRPGRSAMLSRLMEMILMETLRGDEQPWIGPPGLLSGLQDTGIARALEAIHSDVARHWTLERLSRRAGMLRSLFARRFLERVGTTPIEYIIHWRMALARDALVQGSTTMEEIAERIGYRSASAFSAAFSRRVGISPKEFARRFAPSKP